MIASSARRLALVQDLLARGDASEPELAARLAWPAWAVRSAARACEAARELWSYARERGGRRETVWTARAL